MPSPIKPKYKLNTDYIVSKWGEGDSAIDNYECVHCQFKHTMPEKFNEHMDGGAAAHAKLPYPQVDSDGRKLGGKHPALLEHAKKS
jgi:hypothetical protein